jgi:hypothetical protein
MLDEHIIYALLCTSARKVTLAQGMELDRQTIGKTRRREMLLQKVIFGLGVAWLLVISGSISVVYGQAAATIGTVEESTQLGRDLFLTIGLDIWANQWQTFDLVNTVQTGPVVVSLDDISLAFIPNITLTYKNVFISASYMRTLDYEFGEEIGGAETDASRQEGDLTLGFFPLNWLGVAMGYKGVFQDFPSLDLHFNGPILGVLGNARINDSFALSGNVFGGYMDVDCNPETIGASRGFCPQIGNATYIGTKLVLRYAPTTLPQLFLTLGYRVQVLNTDIDGFESDGIDLTHGPVLGVNFRF